MRIERKLDAQEAVLTSARALEKLDREHEQALDTAERAEFVALRQLGAQTEADLGKAFHENLLDVAKGAIDRSRDGAKYVQTAASAIAALYTGILGLAFSVTSRPLPVRGVVATVFLGLSVALSTAYLAYITTSRSQPVYPGGASDAELQLNRSRFFTEWVNKLINQRRWAVRASVFSLAIGVAFIPAGFVATHHTIPIPDAPAPPAIPAAVAPQLSTLAEEVLRSQKTSYESAVKNRNEAIGKAAKESKQISSEEADANRLTLILGGVGILLVLLGPSLIGAVDKSVRHSSA